MSRDKNSKICGSFSSISQDLSTVRHSEYREDPGDEAVFSLPFFQLSVSFTMLSHFPIRLLHFPSHFIFGKMLSRGDRERGVGLLSPSTSGAAVYPRKCLGVPPPPYVIAQNREGYVRGAKKFCFILFLSLCKSPLQNPRRDW